MLTHIASLHIASSLITIIGLAAVGYGSWVTSKAVIISEDEAIKIAGQIGASTYGLVIPEREEFLQQPAVRNLIQQSHKARGGLIWIAFGTGIQIIGVLVGLCEQHVTLS